MRRTPFAWHQRAMAASSAGASMVPAGLQGEATIRPAGRGSSFSSIATVGWKRVEASQGSVRGRIPSAVRILA